MKSTLVKLLPTLFFISMASDIFAKDDKNIEGIIIEMPCYETSDLIKTLTSKFKEKPVLIGKVEDQAGSMMSFWVNDSEKSWTIISTKDEVSCVVGYGKNLNVILRKSGKEL